MKQRGFTLIEVGIVIAILAIMMTPFLDMVTQLYRHYHHTLATAELKESALVASQEVFKLSEQKGCRLLASNRGLENASARIEWSGDRLLKRSNGRETVVATDVQHFSVFRRQGVMTVTLELAKSGQAYRTAYEHPWGSK